MQYVSGEKIGYAQVWYVRYFFLNLAIFQEIIAFFFNEPEIWPVTEYFYSKMLQTLKFIQQSLYDGTSVVLTTRTLVSVS